MGTGGLGTRGPRSLRGGGDRARPTYLKRGMMKTPLIAVLAVVVLFPIAASPAAEPLATFVVDVGKHERGETPVSATLPKGVAATGELRLVETTAGKQAEVPCQTEKTDPPTLWWVLTGTTPAGAKRTFQLLPGKPAAKAGRVEARKGEEATELVVVGADGKDAGKVLRYYHAPLAPPEGVSAKFARSAFIHPAFSPSGAVLTCNFPRDHYHHKGLWNPWTKTQFRGQTVDFWNLGAGKATVRFKEYASLDSGPVFGGFVARHEHVVFPGKGEEVVALHETWQVRAWNVGGPQRGFWLWDIGFTQRCATDDPLIVKKYSYGGMGWRGAEPWQGQAAYGLTSEGKTRKDGNGTRARWCALGGTADGKTAGGVLMTHPGNFLFPEPMRVWPTGMKGVFVSFTAAQLGEFHIEPGKDYVWRYRFCGHDGKVDPALADRLWADFGEPPTITVTPGAKAGPVGTDARRR